MKKLFIILLALTLSMTAVVVASADEFPDEPGMPGRIEGSGTHFELSDSAYLNITLDSSQPIDLILESMPEMVTLSLKPITEALSTQITLSGFLPLNTYYKYEDDYHNVVEFTADENGNYFFTQDLSSEHMVFIQPRPSTKFISDAANGGDCSSIGNWDSSTRTCTLTTDLTETIQIDGDGITLDGNGHTMTGSGTGYGVYLESETGVTIVNLNIQNFYTGIRTFHSDDLTIAGNAINSNNRDGINAYYSDGLTVAGNAINSNNGHGIYLENSDFNTFTGNTVNNNLLGGIIQSLSNSNTYEYNTIVGNGDRTGIHFKNNGWWPKTNSNIVIGNSIANLSLGLYIRDSDSNIISDNDFDSIRYEGIHILDSDEDIIANNDFVNSGGIQLFYCDFSNLTGNTISFGNGYGIYLYDSTNNSVAGNVIYSSPWGIQLSFASYNIIHENTVESILNHGIWINQSNLNQVYNNNFIDNYRLPYVTGLGNVFNLPIPTGGNYWSQFDTPSEGCSDVDNDSFCDSPYVFDGGQDSYPWAMQDGWLIPPYNTPAGDNVVVNPDPAVAVTFSEVTGAGDTTVTKTTVNPGPDKSGFKFLGTYYDVSTTATYTGTLTICWDYDDEGLTDGKEQSLKVFHWEQGQDWTDVTVSLDTVNNRICAEVSSLSWFAIAYDIAPPEITITTPEAYGLYTVGVALDFSAVDTESGVNHLVGQLTNAAGDYQEVSSGFTPPPEVYSLVVVATDVAGNTAEIGPVFFVVYDPEGGFATGGGWIRPDTESTLPGGKAEFGFVANYIQNNATGNLAFQYQDADLRLKSTSINWLVISGVSAQFQGTGTINGGGQYTFRVQAKDNGEPGVGVDSFSIRIWEGTDTEADPIHKAKDTLAGGNIVVRKS